MIWRWSRSPTVVRAVEVVVNGLGDADHAAFIPGLLHEFGNLVAGVHGVVAAVVEKITHVVLAEYFQKAAVVRIVHGGISHFVAAGAQGGCGGVFKQFQFFRVLQGHVVQAFVQHSFNAVGGPQHARNMLALQGCLNGSQSAGVDNGGRTAGLPDDACPFFNAFMEEC